MDYTEAEVIVFQTIHYFLLNMRNGNDLVLIGFPLLSHFNVNVLCLLKQIFKEVSICHENSKRSYDLCTRYDSDFSYRSTLTASMFYICKNLVKRSMNSGQKY